MSDQEDGGGDWVVDRLPPGETPPGEKGITLADIPAYRGDRAFYRTIAASLGLAVLLCVMGAIWVATRGLEVPQVLTAIGSAAIGAFAGVLAAPKAPHD